MVAAAADAMVLRTLDQAVARARAISRRLVSGRPNASLDDFLEDRARETDGE